MLLKSEKLQALASFGHLLSSAKATIDTFSNIYVSRTCKLVNFVAHNLAKHARHVIGFSLLMGTPHLNDVLHAVLPNFSLIKVCGISSNFFFLKKL